MDLPLFKNDITTIVRSQKPVIYSYYRFWVQDIVHQSTPLLEYFAGRVQGSYVTVSMHDSLPDSLIGFGSISLKIWKQNQYIFDLDL